jgi:hypothetical protein
MAHGTNPLVDSFRDVPALVESLRRDPAKMLTSLAKCEQGQAAIRAGAQLIGDIFTTGMSAAPKQPRASALTPATGPEVSGSITSLEGDVLLVNGGSSSLGIMGITSLAVITGSVALLGTVSIVALSRRAQ